MERSPDGKVPHDRHHELIARTLKELASHLSGITEQRLVELATEDLAGVLDDLPAHGPEIRAEARVALAEFGRPAPEAPRLPEDGAALQRGESGNGALFSEAGKPLRARFVDAIMAETPFLSARDNGDLFVYQGGFYSTDALPFIRSWVEEKFRAKGETSSGQFITEVVEAVRRRSYCRRSTFNPPGKLCLTNGILDLESLTVESHSPALPFTFRLPVAFDPDARCPTFDRFLEEILPEREHRKIVLQFFGYCLEPGNPYQVAFLGVGWGNNGKSTCLGTLRDLLGSENVSAETLQSLSEGRFGTANLWGKLANICADIPASPIRYTGTFKLLTGGTDDVRAEHKFGKPFYFKNQAKLLFTANELPPIHDDTSYAFWRRWQIVPFTQDLTGREDRQLPDRLRAELPGILNRAIEGLRSLREVGGFPTPGADDLREEWKRRSEPLYAFVRERVEEASEDWVRKEDLYQAFCEFASEHNLPPMKPEEVGRVLPRYVPKVRSVKPRVPNPDLKAKDRTVQVRAWGGIRLRPLGDTAPPASPASPASLGTFQRLLETGEAGEAGGSASSRGLAEPEIPNSSPRSEPTQEGVADRDQSGERGL